MENKLICICGHEQDAHEHYRAGNDCGQCKCDNYQSIKSFERRLKTDKALILWGVILMITGIMIMITGTMMAIEIGAVGWV